MTSKHEQSGAATYVAQLRTDRAWAQRIADILSESLDATDTACAAFEHADGGWQIDVHFRRRPTPAELQAILAQADSTAKPATVRVQKVTPQDWVKKSLAGLRPVEAGRFVVHGAHDRDRVPPHRVAIEIEAATAFGTGHHGTTRGCLLALDALMHNKPPRYILDLGTGSGVLAIAAAKVFRVPVLATDIDWRAVAIARANARLNGVGTLITAVNAAGLRAPQIVRRAPFDLVLANILLQPLQRLAAPIARQLMPNARVVLSGILREQANAAIAAYRSQGLVLERSFALDGWVTLLMAAASG